MTAPLVVVAGPSGCGKSTVGAALAGALRVPFVDADSLHSPAAVAAMAAGTPLDDVDRRPWLVAVGETLHEAGTQGHGLVMACSALKRAYRTTISAREPHTVYVMLDADRELLEARMVQRSGHFMPVVLAESQLSILEPLAADEPGLRVDASQPVADLVSTTLDWLRVRSTHFATP
jgi:carbohydrate kinase (thermoresistant glucokinase family)